jgi:transposase
VETRATPEKLRIEQDALPQPTLFLAFELGQNKWKLGFTIGLAQQPRERTIPAGALDALQQEIARAKQRFGLPKDARVVSCYEAGHDGFWLHRALVAHGVTNHVIDSASIEVNRRQRQAKTDRLDAHKLLTMLLRHMAGEMNSAWLYVMEFFAWRDFQTPKQVGALAGLTPSPSQSGQSRRELGIAKAGNRHIRAMAIEIAWTWRRFQPASALSQWYEQRFGHGSARVRKLGIVALARKLLIALWRFLKTGVLPEGAVLKAEPASQ